MFIDRNLYYQKQTANEIKLQAIETISSLTLALNIHLNIGQNFTINTPEIFLFLEKSKIEFLSNKTFKQVGNAQIHMPFDFSFNQTVSFRVRLSFNSY
jgi:hypothetical protein